MDAPDVKGRVAILGVHSKNKRLDDEVDLQQIALRTPGFTGAFPCPFVSIFVCVFTIFDS